MMGSARSRSLGWVLTFLSVSCDPRSNIYPPPLEDAGIPEPVFPDDSYLPGQVFPEAEFVHGIANENGFIHWVRGPAYYYGQERGDCIRVPLPGGGARAVRPMCPEHPVGDGTDGLRPDCWDSDPAFQKTTTAIVDLGTRYWGEQRRRAGIPPRCDNDVYHIAVDREMVYWNDAYGTYGWPIDPRRRSDAWQRPPSRSPIVSDDDAVYWADGHDEDGPVRDDEIWRRDKATGDVVSLAHRQWSVHRLAVTDKYVYWRTNNRALRRVEKHGGWPKTIGRHLPVYFMAGVGDSLYFEVYDERGSILYRLRDSWVPPE